MPRNISKRKLRKIRKNQQGGDGQGNQGHDVSMPIQFFGKQLDRYYQANSPDLVPPDSAYGPTIATSHGVSIPGKTDFVGPDLGAFHKDIGISGLQTGGASKKKSRRNLKQKGGDGQGNQGHDVSMPIQYFGGKLDRYFPAGSPELSPSASAYGPTVATSHGVSIPGNNDFVGPDLGAFHKDIGISGLQTGGGSNKKSRRNLKQKGGDGQGNQGHDVSMPIQFFGGKLNRYFPAGSPELVPPNSAYGPTVASSHGVSIPGNSEFVGPDLGPFNASLGISGLQTGGSKKKPKKQSKKSHQNKKKQLGGEKLKLRSPNMDDGPPFHPQWDQAGGDKLKLRAPNMDDGPPFHPQWEQAGGKKKSLAKAKKVNKQDKKKQSRNKAKRQRGGEKLNLRAPNMDDGPPFHPQWGGDDPYVMGDNMTNEKDQKGKNVVQEEDQMGGDVVQEEDQMGGDVVQEEDQMGGNVVQEEDQMGGNVVQEEDQMGGK